MVHNLDDLALCAGVSPNVLGGQAEATEVTIEKLIVEVGYSDEVINVYYGGKVLLVKK